MLLSSFFGTILFILVVLCSQMSSVDTHLNFSNGSLLEIWKWDFSSENIWNAKLFTHTHWKREYFSLPFQSFIQPKFTLYKFTSLFCTWVYFYIFKRIKCELIFIVTRKGDSFLWKVENEGSKSFTNEENIFYWKLTKYKVWPHPEIESWLYNFRFYIQKTIAKLGTNTEHSLNDFKS